MATFGLVCVVVLLALAFVGTMRVVDVVTDWWDERQDRRHPKSAAFGPVRAGIAAPRQIQAMVDEAVAQFQQDYDDYRSGRSK